MKLRTEHDITIYYAQRAIANDLAIGRLAPKDIVTLRILCRYYLSEYGKHIPLPGHRDCNFYMKEGLKRAKELWPKNEPTGEEL